jgi:anti-anti-sigma factor
MTSSVKTRNHDGARSSTEGNVLVVELGLSLTYGTSSTRFHEVIARGLTTGYVRFVVNLGRTTFVDAAGIGELVKAVTEARKRGGDLKICAASEAMSGLLQRTKLRQIFEVTVSQQTAIKRFGATPDNSKRAQ